MTTSFQAQVTAITHSGRVRSRNEDIFAVGEILGNGPMDKALQVVRDLNDPLLCLIADGMAGALGGEFASQLATRLCQEALPGVSDEGSLADALRTINRKMFAAMQESPERRGMGTTLVGLLLTNNGHLHFNVGDSRLYRFKSDFLRQLSVDDVPEGAAIDGDVTRKSGILTQCLGGREAFQDVAPHVCPEPLVPGRRYLLCSDGLTDLIPLEEMEAILSANDDGAAVAELFQAALASGGHDNISIILVSLTQA